MAGWGDWVKYLLNDGNCVCGNVCGIFGPAPNYQYYASDPSDFHVSLRTTNMTKYRA